MRVLAIGSFQVAQLPSGQMPFLAFGNVPIPDRGGTTEPTFTDAVGKEYPCANALRCGSCRNCDRTTKATGDQLRGVS